MKHRLFVFVSLIALFSSTTRILAEVKIPENELNIDVKDNLASINDLILSLGGEIEINEDNKIFTYILEDLTLTIDLSIGYCMVNEELTPYLLLPSEQDSTVINIAYFTPVLNHDEIFVPIQFLERHFDITFENNVFNYYGNLDIMIEEEMDIEEVVVETIIEKVDEEIIEDEWMEETPVITPTPEAPKPTPQPQPPIQTPTPVEPPVETPNPVEPPVETPTPEEPPVETPTPEEPSIETPTPEEPPVETPTPEENPQT